MGWLRTQLVGYAANNVETEGRVSKKEATDLEQALSRATGETTERSSCPQVAGCVENSSENSTTVSQQLATAM